MSIVVTTNGFSTCVVIKLHILCTRMYVECGLVEYEFLKLAEILKIR